MPLGWAGVSREAEAVVEATGPALPKLDAIRDQAEAAPVRWAGNGRVVRMLAAKLREEVFERFAARDWLALR